MYVCIYYYYFPFFLLKSVLISNELLLSKLLLLMIIFQITFKTKIYHPNIDEKGQVCLPIISPENWKPAIRTDKGGLVP